MNDGANWQAQAVLAYLRGNEEYAIDKTWNPTVCKYDTCINVGRFENCREQGYVFSVRYNGSQINYAVYEHRNWDGICVVRFEQGTMNTPELGDVIVAMGDNKWGYTVDFKNGEIVECGRWIIRNIQNFIDQKRQNNGEKKEK